MRGQKGYADRVPGVAERAIARIELQAEADRRKLKRSKGAQYLGAASACFEPTRFRSSTRAKADRTSTRSAQSGSLQPPDAEDPKGHENEIREPRRKPRRDEPVPTEHLGRNDVGVVIEENDEDAQENADEAPAPREPYGKDRCDEREDDARRGYGEA